MTESEKKIRPPVKRAPQFYAAGFFRRLFAFSVDLLVIFPVALLLAWFGGEMIDLAMPASREFTLDFWIDLILMKDLVLLSYLCMVAGIVSFYFFIFQAAFSQTFGMKISGCKVLNSQGYHLSVERALWRTLLYFFCFATLGFGFFWIGVDAEKRGLHDWLAGTYVVLNKPVS